MKPFLGYLLIGLLLVVAIAAVLLFNPLGKRPLETLFPVGELKHTDFGSLKLTDKPNQFLMCPPRYCGAEPHAKSVEFGVSVDLLRQRWQDLIAAEPRVELLAEQDNLQFNYVQRSARFRFPDIVTVRFIPLSPSRSTLAVYSRSVYGRGDFGVNQKRIEEWLRKFRALL